MTHGIGMSRNSPKCISKASESLTKKFSIEIVEIHNPEPRLKLVAVWFMSYYLKKISHANVEVQFTGSILQEAVLLGV